MPTRRATAAPSAASPEAAVADEAATSFAAPLPLDDTATGFGALSIEGDSGTTLGSPVTPDAAAPNLVGPRLAARADEAHESETGMRPAGFAAADADQTILPGVAGNTQAPAPPRALPSAVVSRTGVPRSAGTAPGPPGVADGVTGTFEAGAPGAQASVPGGASGGPLEMGQSFGTRYHIIRLLGLGGMGAVYQAWDSELGVAVALKVVRPEVAADPAAARDLERRFKRELLLARQVTHKNVVRIHDLGEIDGIKYITMPYVEGHDLSTILATEGKLPVGRVLRIARGMVAGLVAAHDAGVVHRDLKPANIMIEAEDEPLIMDFGIALSSGGPAASSAGRPAARPAAWRATQQTMSGAIVGTVQYMAPEQARGEEVDQRADIYAFGLILYDMLVGKRRSAHAPSAIAELQARMQDPPPPVRTIEPDVPEEVDRLITRCIQSDASKRYENTAALAAALDRLDDDGKLKPIPRRFTPKVIAALAAVVLLLVGGAFYAARRLSAPAKQHDPISVAIADFRNSTGDAAFDHTLEPTLRRALEGAGFITAYDRGRLRSTFGVRPPDTLDVVAARELAVKQGLAVVLSGSIDRRGDAFDISIKATETVSQKVVADVSGRAPAKEQVLATTTDLATRVRQALGDETSESAQRFAMRSLSTASLEVVGHYAAAMDAQSRGKPDEALQSFRRAVEIDPEFGLGFQGLAATSMNVGRREDAEKYIKEALRYLDGMTERERMSVRGLYYTMSGDYPQCVKEYRELIGRYAADTVAHNQLATCLAKLRDMRGAVQAMRQAVTILPKHVTYRTNLAVLHAYAGDFAAAEQEVRGIEAPDEVAVLALAFSQLGQGAPAAAATTYQRLRGMGAAGASFATSGLGDLALYEGRFADAVTLLEPGVAAELAAGNRDGAARKLTSIAYAHLSRGEPRAASAAAQKALSHSTALDVRFLSARILLESGQEKQARVLAEDLGLELAPERQAYGKILEGAIALKTGDPRRAIKHLTDASGILDTWFAHFDLGRAYLEAGALLQADGEFDRCIKRRGEVLSLFDEDITYGYLPPVYYYQGRVRQALNTAGFADAYRAYLAIRGNSTDDPLVPEVRKRIGN